ncbi:MAG: hypothetical protein Q8P97_00370 [bacterium]|nr:hypothetical protein [bacterium]
MQELFSKLGVDWKLLLAQAVNFLLLMAVLRFTVYKPLLSLLKERRTKIEKGLEDATLAGERLEEAELMKKEKLAEADRASMVLIRETEKRAKELEAALLGETKKKEEAILLRARQNAEKNTEEEKKRFFEEAGALIKEGLKYVAESSPETIDDKLVSQAVAKLKRAS